MGPKIGREIHHLDKQVEALAGRVGVGGAENVLLAEDRRVALDEEARALVVVGDDAVAENEAFAGLEFDLESHVRAVLGENPSGPRYYPESAERGRAGGIKEK